MNVECATIVVGGIPDRHRWGERDRYVAGCESPDIAGEWSPSAASRRNQRVPGFAPTHRAGDFPELPPVGWGSPGSVIGSG
jgi:hypothetical protein